ncbi:hypothetical protein [Amycolatopsis sp. H20-H5]|uniref:hypothetical protein n=1 Tax=Amycolatopsis sp. H20-H5 TaxID=3046309 RepID=UPI002DBC1907|nr:hypothetical protein [Amycolatopsis sp. H20-H5]MEC3979824.1 hypothetical protein [Amycolatopsis sp. H20-H5]
MPQQIDPANHNGEVDMTDKSDARQSVKVTGPNGVTWTRHPDGTSSGAQLLEALSIFTRMNTDVPLLWNWWEEDRYQREHDRVWAVLTEWDNGASQRESTNEELEAFQRRWNEEHKKAAEEEHQRRADLVARSYNKERASARLQLSFRSSGHARGVASRGRMPGREEEGL